VMSTPGGSSSACEHTFALLLALVRQLPKLTLPCAKAAGKNRLGAEVRGKTLGSSVSAHWERGWRRGRKHSICALLLMIHSSAKRLRGNFPWNSCRSKQLLAKCDFISLHTAVSPQTRDMINAGPLRNEEGRCASLMLPVESSSTKPTWQRRSRAATSRERPRTSLRRAAEKLSADRASECNHHAAVAGSTAEPKKSWAHRLRCRSGTILLKA